MLTGILFFVCTVLPVRVMAARALDHSFPRTANYFLDWTLTPSQAQELSKWDVVILDMEVQRRYPELLKQMRVWNPDIVLLVYITPQEILKDAGASFSRFRRELATTIPEEWFLHDSRGNRLTWWNGTYLLNVTDKAPVVNGQRWQEYLVDFVTTRLLSSGLWDGVFYDNTWDNITYFTGTDIDLDIDSIVDSRPDQSWRNGMKYIYNTTRERTEDRYIIVGNGTTQEYAAELNGALLENFSADAWTSTMQTYEYRLAQAHSPRLSIINANTQNGQTTQHDYQRMRFGLASTLLGDGYYSYDFGDQDHTQLWWYDEYDAHLGKPLGAPKSAGGALAFESDMWTRLFEHGIAAVNSSPVSQAIDLAGDYEKIKGSQDTSINDGSIVSSISLAPFDGQVLLKTFQSLENVLYTNGSFVRFFRPNGARVRNGFFSFEDTYLGGDQILHADLNGNGISDVLVVSGNTIRAWRDDGLPLMNKTYPYGASYKGKMKVAVGDLDLDGVLDVVVAPQAGSALSIKIMNIYGQTIVDSWFPFGQGYTGGYSLAVARFDALAPRIIVGSGRGVEPYISVFTSDLRLERRWLAYDRAVRSGVNVAAGDLDGDGTDEVVSGSGVGTKPRVRVFDATGTALGAADFKAFETFLAPGIDVRVVDIDFDGKGDIVGMSEL